MYYKVAGQVALEGWWTVEADSPEEAEQLVLDTLPGDISIEESSVTIVKLGELIVYEYDPRLP